MKRSAKVAFGGIFSALAVVSMLLTVFPYATYALPAIAGVFLLPIALQCGSRWGLGGYVVTAILAFLLAPDMEAKLLFVLFFGYYPILKLWLDGLNTALQWTLKLLLFNGAAVGGYLLLYWVVGLPADAFQLFGVNLPLVFLALGNVVFILYDRGVHNLVLLYEIHWRDKLTRFWR